MRLIAEGKAPRITQPEEGATYECIQKKDNSKVTCGSSSVKNRSFSDHTLGPDEMSRRFSHQVLHQTEFVSLD